MLLLVTLIKVFHLSFLNTAKITFVPIITEMVSSAASEIFI